MPRNKKSTSAVSPAAEPAAPAAQPEAVDQSNADVSDPAQSSTSAFGKQEHSGRIRGPVEEVIAKRVRTLGKKIQRFRVYAAQPIEKLNADQKSAIASLPILEAQSRELEDLIKSGGPVEVAELGEAAKLRGLKEEVEAKARTDAESASTTHTSALAQPLSRFLNLYNLLHPARSADHEHLTFSPLDLPAQLQDELQATDVLRVGRMYEDLLAGGEKAAEVLGGLVKGPTGDDDENDHIHHLLNLLASPSHADDSAPADIVQSQPEHASESDDREVIETVPETTIEESTATLPQPNGHMEHSGAAKKGGAPLQFLQDDELDSGSAGAAAVEPEQEQEEGFEIVESAAPHETEHYEVPTPSAPEPEVETPAPEPAEPAQESAPAAFDWADEHDEPSAPASAPAETAPEPAAQTPTAEPTPSAPEVTEAGSSTPAPAGGRGGRGGRGRGGPGRGRGGNRPNGVNSPSGQTESGQVNVPIPAQHPGLGRSGSKAGVVVDEDGFEMKVRPTQRGRGGFGGRGGGGGRGGAREGGGGGEYRGGARGRGGGERGGRGGYRGGANGEGQSRGPRPAQAAAAGGGDGSQN